jgi:hypothetical protein
MAAQEYMRYPVMDYEHWASSAPDTVAAQQRKPSKDPQSGPTGGLVRMARLSRSTTMHDRARARDPVRKTGP